MAENIIDILSLSDRPVILVFRHQGLLRRGAEYKRAAIFDQCGYISETVIDRGIDDSYYGRRI